MDVNEIYKPRNITGGAHCITSPGSFAIFMDLCGLGFMIFKLDSLRPDFLTSESRVQVLQLAIGITDRVSLDWLELIYIYIYTYIHRYRIS